MEVPVVYGGKNLWKRNVLRREWKSEEVMDGENIYFYLPSRVVRARHSPTLHYRLFFSQPIMCACHNVPNGFPWRLCRWLSWINDVWSQWPLQYQFKDNVAVHRYFIGDSVAYWLGRRTCDLEVVGSTPGQAAIGLPRSTQPSIPPG